MKLKAFNFFQFVMAMFITTVAQAQWATDAGVNNIVSSATGAQRYVQSTTDGNGGVIMVWEDYRNGTADIFAQRLNAQGVPLWTTNGVAICTATAGQESPVLIFDGSGGAIIAWQDLRSGNYDIYAQKINATGSVQWTANGVVISATTLNQEKPQITSASGGGAMIAWQDNRSGGAGTDYDIYIQRINSLGAVQWTANGVALCTAVGAQFLPTIVALGASSELGAMVSWQDQRTANQDIYAQAVSFGSGSILWSANGVAVCSATGSQFNPAIASDGGSGGIITWEDYRAGSTNADVYAQRLNGSGAPQWTADGVVISSAAANQTKPKLTRSATGEAIVVWEDSRSGNADIFAQRINGTGVVQWATNGVGVCTSTGAQTNPQLVLKSDGGIITTWQDARGANIDLYAQSLDASGATQWVTNGVLIASAINDQTSPSIVYTTASSLNKHGAIIAWEDFRTGSADIYAQRINISGVLCGNVASPGVITGNQTVLAGTSQTYSVASLIGATSYTWTLPAGWTGTSTTNSITVTTSGTSGSVQVSASNSCGTTTDNPTLAITVNKQNQTITFNALTAKNMGDATFNLTATASSTLPVSYISSNTNVATISGSTVTIVGAGTTTITASQAGNEIFNAAPNVPRDLVVNKGNQTITFNTLAAKALGDAPFTLSATASSGLTVAYTSSNTAIATVAGNTVTLVAAGSVTIHANQAGDNNYNAATQVSQTFCVNPPKPTITQTGVNTESPTLTTNATVGNQWYRNDVAIGGATATTLSITQAGVYKVQVTAGGCTSAFSDTFTFVITAETSSTKGEVEIFPNPVTNRLLVRLPGSSEYKSISIFAADGRRMDFKETDANEIEINTSHYGTGFYVVRITSTRINFSSRFTKE